MSTGLVMINTGNGKGKTTSSLGMTLRFLGHEKRVSIIQFIKGSKYGEHTALERFSDLLTMNTMGIGFTNQKEKDDHVRAAKEAWEFAKNEISNTDNKLIVLDEFTYVLNYNYIDTNEVIEFLRKRDPSQHIVITGRDASDQLCEFADMVSVIEPLKHHFKSGISAQIGVEF